jgi:hypothetical protein
MQIGAENRNKTIALIVLGVIAAIALPYSLSRGSATPTGTAAVSPATEAKKVTRNNDRTSQKWPPANKIQTTASLDPALRLDLLKQSEDQQYEGTKCNIFAGCETGVKIPKPVDPGILRKQQEEQQRQANTPPPPPPIPLKFYGFATQAGQPKRVFLSSTSGDDVFVGTEGQVINKRYRIVKINNASVEMEDILNSNKQTLPLTSPQT